APRAEILQPLHDRPIRRREIALRETRRAREARPLRQRRRAPILAGEKTAGERKIRQQPQSAGRHRGHELGLDVALEQAVLVLARYEAVEIALPGGPVGLDRLP